MNNEKNIAVRIDQQVRDLVIKYFNSKPDISAVYIFGSFATGSNNSESDIDIAFVSAVENSYNQFDILQMREEISDLLRRDVDLVCLNRASVILRMQVYRKGIKILDKNPHITNTLLVRSVFEYDDLRYIRTPIEAKILKGRIYG